MADERRVPGRGPRRDPDRPDTGPRTRRIVVLLALGVICALVLAPPLRLYVQQQQQISALRGEISDREADVAGLEAEVRLWQEDTYVAAQARERLNFVMPGETGFVVPSPDPTEPAGAVDGAGEMVLARPDADPEGTWYARLWSSVEAVGTGTTDPVLDAPVVSEPVDD